MDGERDRPRAPAWLRNYETKASFGFSADQRGLFTEAETIAGALVNEVSILSPGTKPAEPLARVMLVKRSTVPTSSHRAVAADDQGTVFNGGPMLRRPNIGRVTAVR